MYEVGCLMLFFLIPFTFVNLLATMSEYFYKFLTIAVKRRELLVVKVTITVKELYPIEAFTRLFQGDETLTFKICFTYGTCCFSINLVDFCHDSTKLKQAWLCTRCSILPLLVPCGLGISV